jgi:hypothetical protein
MDKRRLGLSVCLIVNVAVACVVSAIQWTREANHKVIMATAEMNENSTKLAICKVGTFMAV